MRANLLARIKLFVSRYNFFSVLNILWSQKPKNQNVTIEHHKNVNNIN